MRRANAARILNQNLLGILRVGEQLFDAGHHATKIIIPSELQNLGGVVPAIKELVTEPRKEE